MHAEYRPAKILGVVTLVALASCATEDSVDGGVRRVAGAVVELGRGDVESYADVDGADVLVALGVSFAAAALEGLPAEVSDGNRCFDGNDDGTIELHSECAPWHERVIPLPTGLTRRGMMSVFSGSPTTTGSLSSTRRDLDGRARFTKNGR